VFSTPVGKVVQIVLSLLDSNYRPVPHSPRDITPAWLRGKHPTLSKVTSVQVEPLGGLGFIGETVRLKVGLEGGTEGACKTPPTANLAQKA
jgi:hypothetical protein